MIQVVIMRKIGEAVWEKWSRFWDSGTLGLWDSGTPNSYILGVFIPSSSFIFFSHKLNHHHHHHEDVIGHYRDMFLMMMPRSRMRRRRRRGERSNASHYKVLPPYQALQETPSTIRETLCTRKYTVCNSHRDVLCSRSMSSAVRGSLEWAVEESVRLCFDV